LPPTPSFIQRALSPAPPPYSPATLLLLSIRVMLHASAELTPAEEALQDLILSLLPELQAVPLEATDEALSLLIASHLQQSPIDDIDAASPRERLTLFLSTLQALRHLPTEALRKKCFILCAELASLDLASSPTKDLILEHIYTILGIAPDTARMILHALAIKYRP
jgi:hypothetical protein